MDVSAIGSSRTEHGPGTIRRCGNCGHAFRLFRPTQDELAALYRDMRTDVYDSETVQRKRTAAQYFEIVKRRTARKTVSILDVGCGSGLFLELAARNGWFVAGIEPSIRFFRAAQERLGAQAQLANVTLQDADLPAESFDVVTAWDVIEHVEDPVDFVMRCARLLRPGGLLFVKAPDIESLAARLMGSHWPVLLPEHLHYFTRRSLEICGKRTGLWPAHFSRQPVFFSLDYMLYRLSHHGIPASRWIHRVVQKTFLAGAVVPISVGELHVQWTKPEEPEVLGTNAR